MVAQGGSSVGTYSLENLELQYETIDSIDITTEVTSSYSTGRSLAFEHCTPMKTTVWDKASVLINKNVNLPRKSMKGIVCQFSKTTSPTDSEKYLYPN